jgi:hypothetical protein
MSDIDDAGYRTATEAEVREMNVQTCATQLARNMEKSQKKGDAYAAEILAEKGREKRPGNSINADPRYLPVADAEELSGIPAKR